MMMSPLLCLNVAYGHKEWIKMINGEVVNFKYYKVVADNYRYRGSNGRAQRLEA